MDIYDRLHDEHVEIRFLLREIAKTTTRSCDKRQELYQQLKTLLIAHREFEEAVFYAGLRKAKDAKIMLVEALNEHHLSAIILKDLDRLPIEKRAWLGKFTILREILDHHLREEETELFVRARRLLDVRQLPERLVEPRRAGLTAAM